MAFSDAASFSFRSPKENNSFISDQGLQPRPGTSTSPYGLQKLNQYDQSSWDPNSNLRRSGEGSLEPTTTMRQPQTQLYPSHPPPSMPYPSTSSLAPKDPYSIRGGAGSGGVPATLLGGFPASSFNYAHGNVRNTRPMTAPTTSTPYFSNGIYSPAPHHPNETAAFYPSDHNATFNYQVDSQSSRDEASDAFRARGFSLPEIAGIPNSLDRSSNYNSTTVRQGDEDQGAEDDSDTSSSADDSEQEPYSRPTTGDSRHSSSRVDRKGLESRSSRQRARSDAASFQPLAYSDSNETARQRFDDDSRVYSLMHQRTNKASKRPRRRFDEIERLYTCDYPECPKAYGTLNHLNSHKTMQKHGPKSTPAQFKDLRKAWRDRKKAAATAALAPNRISFETQQSRPNPTPSTGADLYQRPRLHTSAGEYCYTPTPFFSATYDGSTYPLPQQQAPLHSQDSQQQPQYTPSSAQFSFDILQSAMPYPEPPVSSQSPYEQQHQQYRSNGSNMMNGYPLTSHRPVTAPSYYPGPSSSFGQQSPFIHSPTLDENGATSGSGLSPQMGGIAARRMSLPLAEPRLATGPNGFGFLSQNPSIEEEDSTGLASYGNNGLSELDSRH